MNNTTDYTTYNNGDDVMALLKVGIYINNYYLWVIFAFGFPGNLASVVTILRMQRVTTSTFYVATLAIIDNFAIVLKLLYNQLTLREVWLGSSGCKLLNFLSLILPTFANWILVFIATERLVAVRSPLKIGMYWSIPRAALSVLCLGAIIFGMFCHIFWTFTDLGSGIHCWIFPEYISFYRNVWYWLNAAVYSFIPCLLLAIFNVLIIRSVKKSSTIRNQLSMKKSKCSSGKGGKFRQDSQITIMLVSVAVVFVILTVPRCIFVVLHLYWEVEYNTMEDAQKYLLDQLTYFLCDSNHAINFYLYFITGKKFRRHFLDTVLCRRHRMLLRKTSQSGVSLTLQTKYTSNSVDDGQVEDGV